MHVRTPRPLGAVRSGGAERAARFARPLHTRRRGWSSEPPCSPQPAVTGRPARTQRTAAVMRSQDAWALVPWGSAVQVSGAGAARTRQDLPWVPGASRRHRRHPRPGPPHTVPLAETRGEVAVCVCARGASGCPTSMCQPELPPAPVGQARQVTSDPGSVLRQQEATLASGQRRGRAASSGWGRSDVGSAAGWARRGDRCSQLRGHPMEAGSHARAAPTPSSSRKRSLTAARAPPGANSPGPAPSAETGRPPRAGSRALGRSGAAAGRAVTSEVAAWARDARARELTQATGAHPRQGVRGAPAPACRRGGRGSAAGTRPWRVAPAMACGVAARGPR